jgi:hypothetical protein
MRAPHDTPSRGVVKKICDFGCKGLSSGPPAPPV